MDMNSKEEVSLLITFFFGNYVTNDIIIMKNKAVPKSQRKKLLLFRMDMYSGQPYSNETVATAYNSATQQDLRLEDEVLEKHKTDSELRVEISSPYRKWIEWNKEVRLVAAKMAGSIEEGGNDLILSGKAPLSMFLHLGARLGSSSLLIANEVTRGNWQVFDIDKSQNRLEEMEVEAAAEELFNIEQGPLSHAPVDGEVSKYVLVFLTLNGAYSFSLEDVSHMENILKNARGSQCSIIDHFRLGPKNPATSLRLISGNAVADASSCSLEVVSKSLEKLWSKISTQYARQLAGIIAMSSGPQPVSYIMGTGHKPNLFGELVLMEVTRDFATNSNSFQFAGPFEDEASGSGI
jgi:hypothetical protein